MSNIITVNEQVQISAGNKSGSFSVQTYKDTDGNKEKFNIKPTEISYSGNDLDSEDVVIYNDKEVA